MTPLARAELVAPDGAPAPSEAARNLAATGERPGEPVSRYEIAERLGKTVDLPDHRDVDQAVRRLRRKIEATMEVEAPIPSAHAVGYSFIGPIGRV